MMLNLLSTLLLFCCAIAAPLNGMLPTENIENLSLHRPSKQKSPIKDDLKAAATSYTHQYSDWGGISPGGYEYSVTGIGVINDKYDANIGGYNYKNKGYAGYVGNEGFFPSTGYDGGAWPSNNIEYGSFRTYGGYSGSAYEGNGGYGGYGGNGGLNSYDGYNNPFYQGSNHLGYGYYNKRPGYSNVYSGITPSLVTGYRGYSKK
ncbi:heterogeneous nuclear ribonucleoprotein A2 homolog 1-like [Battus philenor]|uniref:heterogeneous nuclear ribonucleoprotein A2 homolog 1-like n=1 Tax=Battus philenor TaxID=42288 RepID=UPI0035D0CE3D